MKKLTALAVIGLAITAQNAFGQAMINVNDYSKLFLNGSGNLSRRYYTVATDDDYKRIASLGKEDDIVDTPLEIALLSMCAGVIDIRPAEADAILPKNNPKLADQKLGAAVFQEIQVLRFLGDTAAVSRHEAVLKFITDRKNATRQEIEAFYRQHIGVLVAEVVDAEAAKRTPTNPATIAEIKQIMTNFFLNPTMENHNVLYQKERQYATNDGQRGTNASFVLVRAVDEFNPELGASVLR